MLGGDRGGRVRWVVGVRDAGRLPEGRSRGVREGRVERRVSSNMHQGERLWEILLVESNKMQAEDPRTARRRDWARLLLQQADALHVELLRAKEAQAVEEEELVLTPAPAVAVPATAASRRVRHSDAVRAAKEEVRRAKERAEIARSQLNAAAAKHRGGGRTHRGAGVVAANNPARAATNASPADACAKGVPATAPRVDDAATREERAELQKLRLELQRDEREVAALRDREIALAGVLSALSVHEKPEKRTGSDATVATRTRRRPRGV